MSRLKIEFRVSNVLSSTNNIQRQRHEIHTWSTECPMETYTTYVCVERFVYRQTNKNAFSYISVSIVSMV